MIRLRILINRFTVLPVNYSEMGIMVEEKKSKWGEAEKRRRGEGEKGIFDPEFTQ